MLSNFGMQYLGSAFYNKFSLYENITELNFACWNVNYVFVFTYQTLRYAIKWYDEDKTNFSILMGMANHCFVDSKLTKSLSTDGHWYDRANFSILSIYINIYPWSGNSFLWFIFNNLYSTAKIIHMCILIYNY